MSSRLFKKCLTVAVIFLFISVSCITSIGNVASFDDTTPPVTTHSLDPENPDGDNGWYVSDVYATLNATDDESGVKEIKYTIDGVPGSITGNHGTFKIEDDGKNIEVEYWAIDNVGNVEPKHSFTIDMDQTPPDVPDKISWDAFQENGKWYVRFWVNCTDSMSDMNRVEWFLNNVVQKIDKDPGPNYEWIVEIDIDYRISGLICYRQITGENVSFFAIFVWYDSSFSSSLFWDLFTVEAVAYDNAGNSDYIEFDGSWVPPPPNYPTIFTHFTFQNDYKGYIGRFFINAVFEEEPFEITSRCTMK